MTAVKKADLVNTLNSAQGITVFAPTNDAFAAVPKPTLDKALGDPKGLLTTVLTYHVVPGQLAPDQLAGKTLQERHHPGQRQQDFKSTATPASSAAASRPPTPLSTSSTRCSSPRADHHHPARRGHRHHHASGRAAHPPPAPRTVQRQSVLLQP